MHHKHIQVMDQNHQRLEPILLIWCLHLFLFPIETLYFWFQQKEQLYYGFGYFL